MSWPDAYLPTAPQSGDRISRWILKLHAKVERRKALVALAIKHARIIWNLLTKKEGSVADHVPKGFSPGRYSGGQNQHLDFTRSCTTGINDRQDRTRQSRLTPTHAEAVPNSERKTVERL
jgi:hypothetical protein